MCHKTYVLRHILCIAMAALEVFMEILLPFITAIIIDKGLEAANLSVVYRYGAVMVVMALCSLLFGAMAGKFAASASSGLSANLREAIYARIQTFSFSNIDKFSVPGLVTRMTTDITNVQNAFMMVIRIAVRAPLMLIFSYVMCLIISPPMSLMFLIAVVFLVVVLGVIMVVTLKIFNRVFQKYDDLNASVQENISAIRVVKAFVRESYENSKFAKASANLYKLFVKAEGLLAFNNPAMMLAVYFCILSASWLGAQFIVSGSMTTGDLTSLFSYIMSLLMSLMMLSMVVVMISMSMASIRYGNLEASDEECIAAATLANADGFIRRLPDGYNTMLTGDGANLSQGQRQLLAIARAAVADPPVLILDEATSSIDTRTEKLVQDGMDALMTGRTTFVIAHRLSTVRNADCIMVMEQGRIIERGTHDQLIEKKGRYYQLYTGNLAEEAG